MKTILTRLFTVIMLMMFSLAVGAKVEVEFNKEYKGGKVSVKSQSDNSDGSTLVTITVTPDKGYTITNNEKNKTVIVYAVLPAGGQGRTRAPEIATELKVTGSTATVSYPNSVDYQFTVPAGLNAWVQEVKFQENTSKPTRGIPFDITTADDVTNRTEKLYWMESYGAPGFYMIAHTNNLNNNNNTYASTSNMPNERMLWYFMDAGTVSETKYYYIVNKSTGKYLKQTGTLGQDNTVQLAALGSGGDAFKFSLGGSEGEWIFYPKTGAGNYWLNKKSGNVPYDKWMKSSNWGNTPDENSKWNIIPKNDIAWTHPFEDSTNDVLHYYAIRNHQKNSFYMSTQGSETNVTVSNQNNHKRVWLFKQASSDASIPNMKYYYIINVETGKYMYYNGVATNGNSEVADAINYQEHSGGEEDRYQFAILNAIGKEYSAYSIMPKSLIGNYDNKNTSFGPSSLSDGQTIKTTKDRGSDDNPNHWTIEAVDNYLTAPVISYDKATNKFTITSTDGGTIYYTTNGDTPTASTGTAYPEGGFTFTNEMTEIKAVAVISSSKITPVATKQINTYTFKIVNKSYKVAVIKAEKLPEGTLLSGYTSIPADIRSEYLSGEEVSFRSFAGSEGVGDEVTQATLNGYDRINFTPAGGDANIYVTYTTNHLMKKFLHLRGFRTFNVKVNESGHKFLWDDNSGTDVDKEAATGGTDEAKRTATKAEKPYMWYFGGNDPYAVFVRNVSTSRYLHYISPNLTLGESEIFIMKDSNPLLIASEDGTGTVTLQNAAGETVDLIVTPVALPLHFCLIDKAGKVIESDISYTGSFALPAEWQSPLCTNKYKFYKAASESDGTFTFSETDRISGIEGLGPNDNVIYVTYDVDNTVLDITGKKTYLLKFSGGDSFYQEKGDAISTDYTKAIYPYNNGDFNLNIYGQAQWDSQLSDGASTRTRWLWYFVSSQDGTPLEGDDIDPYHVIVKSRQNQTTKVDGVTTDGNTYLYTYKPNETVGVVTGSISDHSAVTVEKPTEYMILGMSTSNMVLKTFKEVAGSRQIVNRFEQYWKNNPTANDLLGKGGKDKVTAREENVNLTNDQRTFLESANEGLHKSAWHSYNAWAYSAPWVRRTDGTTNKRLEKKEHWFQTISMSNGDFTVEEKELAPVLILLDQHGWEFARLPIPSSSTDTEGYAKIKKYNSPMVSKYHYWKPVTTDKVDGYHKYNVSDPVLNSEVTAGGDSEHYTTTKLGEEGTIPQIKDAKGNLCDLYVTYDVKPLYANAYAGADNIDDTRASAYLVKQGDLYAKISDSNALITEDTEPDIMSVPDNLQWYLRPNFDIDKEMGYLYEGETGAQDGAGKKGENEAAYVSAGKNGFDPYNVQIQSVKNRARYFTTNTTDSELKGGIWVSKEGTTSTLSLLGLETWQTPEGSDQTTLNITNATFMVVDDGSGNMRLMPRFDNTVVVNSLTGTQLAALNEADKNLTLEMVPTVVSKSSDIKSVGGHFILSEGFTIDSSVGSSGAPFKGIIDGQLHTIKSSDKALVAYAEDATIRNVIIESAGISSSNADGHAGAIVATAKGDTRVYNCGVNDGSVSGTNHVGGIVGHLDGSARVINCYSYANITSGSDKGGIVGYNTHKSTAGSLKTMVMNCMFYGLISDGGNVSPVYGGEIIENRKTDTQNTMGLTNFNYYAYEKLKTATINKYNCALAVEERYLTRFEIYRQLLNSNKRLAAYYITGNPADTELLAKWVLETADRSIAKPKQYPVLKKQGIYPSIINYDTRNLANYSEENRNQGLKTGTLSVKISDVGTNAPSGASLKDADGNPINTYREITLVRTDKDFEHFNFNYDKVQLPYYDEVGEGNYAKASDGKARVVTGWKITGMTGSSGDDVATAGGYTASDGWDGYNFANRMKWGKDIYDVSGRVFSQGAYFDVPYGVTAITIEPYWAQAVFVADEYLDVVYNPSYGVDNVQNLGKQFPTGKINIGGSEQTVYTSVSTATGQLGSGGVYDNAIVLVGNLHQGTVPSGNSKKFTMMSVDLDKDHEPDYSMIYSDNARTAVNPIRFDFINMPGTAQAQKPNTATAFRNASVFNPNGWFEVTNTCLVYFSQFEYENNTKKTSGQSPIILLGGVYDQFVSTKESSPVSTTYIHVGSNAWFNDFGNGTHSDGSGSTTHVPVSVTGGEYKGFYLTGTYNANAAPKSDNAECYISGGHFEECAGAGLEQINGNVRWQIYDADIDNFFGGGINDAKPIQGTITTEIFNSHVGIFCGGPKFGNMVTDKDVTTTAKGCTFDKYFGAGYGGNSISKKKYYDKDGTQSWSTLEAYYEGSKGDKGKYYDGYSTEVKGHNGKLYGYKGPGVAVDFDYEFFVWTTGATGARFFVKFATFSLAQCHNVSSTLTGCTVNQDFYGGGSLGNVTGKATSVLDGCTVHGNVFGGGYSASLPQIPFRTAGFKSGKYPNINTSSGMFEQGEFSDTLPYEWKYATDESVTLSNGGTGIDTDNKYVYSAIALTGLGQVGETDVTVKGNTVVEGKIFNAEGADTGEQTGGVFGGGDESAVNGNAKVDIQATAAAGVLNVFGGGNTADVLGDASVTMTGGTIVQDVYGGGKGQTTVVGGDVTVNIGPKVNDEDILTIGNVYGGSALGNVNAKKEGSSLVYAGTDDDPKTTVVNIKAGTVTGSVFGGGLGKLAVAADPGNNIEAQDPIVALNKGVTTINVEGGNVNTAVYGGANINGVLEQDATVTITGGTVGTAPGEGESIANAVFGGGLGEPTLVNGNVTVNIGTKVGDVYTGTATINGHVYGGGALGSVNASKPASDLVFEATKATTVNLYKGTINGDVYGGGLGQKNGVNTSDVEAYVGGNVTVELNNGVPDTEKGCVVDGRIFGCNNQNGSPKGTVTVHVYKTQYKTSNRITNPAKADPSDPDPTEKVKGRYDVAAVYGGGNEAAYDPTDRANGKTVVVIEGCEQTSINYVYGGGNAAAVPATEVTVKSSYEIGYLFGGGNGSNLLKPGADVGIIDLAAYNLNPANGTYGTGNAVTKLEGGTINYVYGGSNTNGNVRGGTQVERKETSSCRLIVKEIYGAGQVAPMDGTVYIYLECMPEDYVDQVFGGAQDAVVDGGVTLTVTSGKFGRVFGGNDTGGSINGPITVRVKEEGCRELEIGELFGGGNMAPYSKYGYTKNESTGKWEANEEIPGNLKIHFSENEQYPYPIKVFVESCTSIGSIFGGGLGASATVTGDTYVNVNMMYGSVENTETHVTTKKTALGHIGQIFGGGKEANVKGNTKIDVGTEAGNEPYGVIITPTIGVAGSEDYNKTKYLNWNKDEYVGGINYISLPASEAGIYGGGKNADVIGNTTLNIGTKETTELSLGTKITGSIYGGGQGKDTKVHGSVAVTIGNRTETTTESGTTVSFAGNATITGDVYGGSALGTVNSSDNTDATEYATTSVTVNYGTITGSVFGGGFGHRDDPGDDSDQDIQANVFGPVNVTINNGTVSQSVYGCNNQNGSPKTAVTVNVTGGTVTENVYGGGNLAAYDGSSDLTVSMSGGTATNVFGGGLGSTADVTGNTIVNVSGGTISNNIYGGGSEADLTGNATVSVSGGSAKTVYGGGNAANVTGNTTVAITGGTLSGTVFGSVRAAVFGGGYGETTLVGGSVTVDVGSCTSTTTHNDQTDEDETTTTYGGNADITGDVYGGSAKGKVNTTNGTSISTGSPTTHVNLYGGAIDGSLYGGGLGEDNEGTENDHAAHVFGAVVVTTAGEGSVHNVFGCNNILGAPQSTVTVNIGGSTISHDVYGGGNQAAYMYTDAAHPQNLQVNVTGGTVNNDVFGGGLSAEVAGGINVSVSGGKIANDVYGGGALANTNTANWDTSGSAVKYDPVDRLTKQTYKAKAVTEGYPVTGLFTRSGDSEPYTYTVIEYAEPEVTADGSTTYYEIDGAGSPVSGYYTKSGDIYTKITSGAAACEAGITYYKKDIVGTWATGMNDSSTGTKYKTNVSLTGGLIGNAYGGGLGNTTTAANVYGDVLVTVNKPSEISATSGLGVAFTQETDRVDFGEGDKKKEYIVPLTGRVFGCNNLNGTPTGNVKVEVYSTRQIDENNEIIAGHGSSNRKYSYEMQAVYGGGNQSDYLPAADKQTKVYVEGCDVTSIEKVYGGGNSASVPTTDVTIHSAYDIGYAFGGGNGGDLVKRGTTWYDNDGAVVFGVATIRPQGGKIGQIFGGSDAKGRCGSTDIDKTVATAGCKLVTTRMYGAGNEADADHVTITISGCTAENTDIEYVYGGSYNAHIAHDINLTIISGVFKYVYGGNDRTGSIGGNITVNIEETENCAKPLIIENLLGGGNEAPYPGTRRNGTEITTPGKITVNVKSATRIDNIYGGSYKADVNGDTEVNINMTKGFWAGKEYKGETLPNIGTIGTVYGGGNLGLVRGSSTVNIGTETTIGYVTEPVHLRADPEVAIAKNGEGLYEVTVEGAHITGDVYGGGKEANVRGNTTVNIGAKETTGVYAAVAEGTEKVTVGGNVYGGGKGKDDSFTCAKAMVGVVDSGTGDTKVVIGNGTVSGDVYGGGEIGRVENNTVVTIGIGNGDTGSAPVITGSVFGGGAGVETHGYSALVRGNSDVTVQGDAKVKKNVYGGGKYGTVGKYWVTGVNYSPLTPPAPPTGTGNNMPYATRSGGKCTVIVKGKAQIGPDGGATATEGHVYGAGMGVETAYIDEGANRSKRMVTYDGSIYELDGRGYTWDYYEADHNFAWEYFDTKDKYLTYLQTLALVSDADVTITGNAKVKGNVYGGSQSGFVQRNTEVKILSSNVTIGATGSYGNVFGGGKGLPRYGSGDGLKGFDEAGHVKGNANTTISGGIINGSVYGGGELGFVGKFNTTDHRNYTWNKTNEGDTEATGICTVAISGTTIVEGHVFGASKGKDDTFECEQAMVRKTSVTIEAGTVKGNVYGGGEIGRVDQDANVELGVADASSGTAAPDIKGYVFGAGQGVETHGYSGLARGNTTIIIQGNTNVGKNVYGGGEIAAVGRYGLDDAGMPSTLVSGGECTVTVKDYAIIGYNGGGNVYGASKGVDESKKTYSYTNNANRPKRMMTYSSSLYNDDNSDLWEYTASDEKYVWEYFDTRDKYLNFLQTLALVTDTYLTVDGNASVKGSAYGGSESGFVQRDTDVKIQGSSTIGTSDPVLIGHVFGGGKGVSGFDMAGRVRGNTAVTVSGSAIITGNVYGGGELGFVGKFNYSTDGRSYEWQKIRKKGDAEGTTNYDTGASVVTITGGTIGYSEGATANHASGHVFAAGKGEALTFKCEPAIMRTASVSVTNGIVYGNVYGGGEISRVDEHTVVKIGNGEGSSGGAAAPDIKGNVFGAGAGVDTHGYSALVRGNTTVTVEGNAKVKKNVYGGGEIAAVGKYSLDANNMPTSLVSDNLGICTVTVRGYAEIGYKGAASDAGHLFGASKGVVPDYKYNTSDLENSSKRMTLYTNSTDFPTDKENVTWQYYASGSPFVWEYFDTEAKYKTFLETLALATQTNVTIGDNATIKGNVYGGSENGFVQHHVSVTMNAGEIGTVGSYGDIYGGGKGLEGFDVAGRVSGNVTLTINNGTIHRSVYGGGEMGIVKGSVTVDMQGGSVGNNLYGGGALADTNTDNWDASTNNWADATKKSALYTTHVSLRGGTIAHDAYGGALGRFEKGTSGDPDYESLVEPKVYGDILLVLNGIIGVSDGKITETTIAETAKGCIVEKVFGCNYLCGTPLGHVKVHVFATQNSGTADVQTKSPNYYPNKGESDEYAPFLKALIDVAKPAGNVLTGIDADVITAAETTYNTYKDTADGGLTDDNKTAIMTDAKKVIAELEKVQSYDVQAVYGGGDLAPYVPKESYEETEVVIDGCHLTCIKQVYGGGNAASTPANYLRVNECFLIDELFGGGNGKDSYTKNGKVYANPGADVGYKLHHHYDTGGSHGNGLSEATKYEAIINDDATTKEDRQNSAHSYIYGTGRANTEIAGGRIHDAYGGSNMKGNIRTIALSKYQASDVCPMIVDKTTGAGKDALIDGEARIDMGCVNTVDAIYGGSTNADMNSGVTLNITNGTINKVFGGNELAGTINGPITINVEEKGCQPIFINELYGGGYFASYSVYGFEKNSDGTYKTITETDPTDASKTINSRIPYKPGDSGALTTPHRDPQINIISATRIDAIYGGGYKALMVGSPHINVNMQKGIVLATYANATGASADYTKGTHGTSPNDYVVDEHPANKDAILAIGKIGYIFGGGNEADVYGNTYVDIGTGKWLDVDGKISTTDADGKTYTYEEKSSGVWKWYDDHGVEVATDPVPSRKAANITGSVYGGGKMGHVGYFTAKNASGKPTTCYTGTGKCYVTVSNGEIGPDNMKMTATGGPDDAGHVFGAGQGSNLPANDNAAYTDYTEVTINGDAFVKGSVYGGSENGHVLHDTHVVIDGDCQIGNGHILNTTTSADRGVNRRYTAAEWAAGNLFVEGDPDVDDESDAEIALRAAAGTMFNGSLPECASWPYKSPYAPHDKYDVSGGVSATDGHTFYGNVFGGGSGYYPYASDSWNMKAGWVEGNTHLEINGGHILTSAYGGNEMTNVGDGLTADKGKATVTMTGGTLGVPRTLAQIDAHPVTCYLFGSGKGDQHTHFNKDTNVKEVEMEITGGRIYGSVFGGGEDGHVLGDVKMTIGNSDGTGPTIGTFGTSYVEGNVFGGGRGFSGEALTAGNVGGSVNLSIKGGTMMGSVYGGGRLASVGYGLYLVDEEVDGVKPYGVMRDNDKMDDGTATDYFTTSGLNKNGRGNIVVNISGGTIGNNLEYVYVNADNASIVGTGDIKKTEFSDPASFTEKVKDEDGLITEASSSTTFRRLSHTKGGNVYGGSMGRIYKLDNTTPIDNWDKLGHAKSTTVTISGNALIKSSVFGGSELGQVEGNTSVTVSGGTIGSEITKTIGVGENATDVTQYSFGAVYGGGYGSEILLTSKPNPRELAGKVGGSSTVNLSGGKVKASVYGGGKIATIENHTYVNVSGGEIGLNKVRKGDGYVMYGGEAMGNVYGGGKGSLTYPLMGVVKGNTNVTISGGSIYHNIYGGGALASVGTFDLSTDGNKGTYYVPDAGFPVNWTANTGTATVTITGGTIGISGRDNGMVNGSSRGDISAVEHPGVDVDPYDKVAWVNNTIVTIGTDDDTSTYTTPLITGNVYGGGENGHNRADSQVNIYDGTIGVVSGTWAEFKNGEGNVDATKTHEVNNSRGAVYGAGCGQDTYKVDGKDYYNPWGGSVFGNSNVTVKGGLIARNVYGGGSIASVGTITNETKHTDETTSFALSWPYKFEYASNTGVATVDIQGGHIGMGSDRIVGLDNGNIYGGSKGDAGDRYEMAHIANVKETYVTINLPYSNEDPSTLLGSEHYDKKSIEGSVFGGGENGHVIEDTHVTLTNGFVSHSMFGGGRGEGRYKGTLIKVGTGIGYAGYPKLTEERTSERDIYDWTAGKVYGNTHLTIVNGRILNNVLGGGYMASVGVGSYASGSDDYYPTGYGETLNEATAKADRTLWDKGNDNSLAFWNSGNTYVNVFGGEIGSTALWDDLPAGNIFGGCRGLAAPNLRESYRYLYNPEWLNGYTNETHVTIGGGYECKAICTDKNGKSHAVGEKMSLCELQDLFAGLTTIVAANGTPSDTYWTKMSGAGPKIYGSVYGGAQDGRVRRDAHVVVNAGEIGLPYGDTVLQDEDDNYITDLDDPQWLHRGNVYGAGSGISLYKFDANGDGDTDDNGENGVSYYETTLNEVGYSQYSGTVLRFTQVDILGGTIHRNVYGGGSMGSVGPPAIPPLREDVADKKGDTTHGVGWQSQNTVNIGGAGSVTIGTNPGYNLLYGGEVYGACRGMSTLPSNLFATSVWTQVNVKNGATIMGNVYGGGDNGIVKKDTEVNIGDPVTP